MKRFWFGLGLEIVDGLFMFGRNRGWINPSWLPTYYDAVIDFLIPLPLMIVSFFLLLFGTRTYLNQKNKRTYN